MSTDFFHVEELRFLDCGPFSFTLGEGECVGISGSSGVGKTQLLRALSDLIPSSGIISFLGTEKDQYKATDWRRVVTMLPTDSVWWYEDLAAHFPAGQSSHFLSVATELGFPGDILSWQVGRLSTGEKQRLALIRSLLVEPSIVLLDEPTSALDSSNVTRVENLLTTLRKNKRVTLLWVSHDQEQLTRVCDRVLVMTKEAIVCATEVVE